MIDRYTTPEMKELWGERSRLDALLRVELAACRAWESLGEIPAGTTQAPEDALTRRPLHRELVARDAQIERETRHDIVAFTRALTERVGEPAKYIHLGLTSTDVVDTAQNLQLREACTIVESDVRALLEAVRELAVRYKHLPVIGRTHGIHAEPMTFGLKWLNFSAALERDLERLAAARQAVAVAKISGSVGTYAHVPPEVEEGVAGELGLAVDPVSNQTVARDRHAQLLSALAILGILVGALVGALTLQVNLWLGVLLTAVIVGAVAAAGHRTRHRS